MPLPLRALARLVVCSGLASFASLVLLGDGYSPVGTEYRIVGSLPGDQVFPRMAFNVDGGYVVWQDNATDGDGSGISARRLDATLSGTLSTFRVNQLGAGDQQNPRVAMLANGGAVFAWQGPVGARSRIYARFVAANGTFVTGDVLVNTYVQNLQIDPAVACLADGTVVIAWASYQQDGSYYGVYAQRFSATGQKLGGEFSVNQTTIYNQRSPVVAPLADGRFMVLWVSERYRGVANSVDPSGNTSFDSGVERYDVDLYARTFDAQGQGLQDEAKVNSTALVCANPEVTAGPDGGVLVVWSGKPNQMVSDKGVINTDSWDVYARAYSSSGLAVSDDFRVNTFTYGDQYLPKAAAAAGGYLVVWTSLNQDWSREGVFGQVLTSSGLRNGVEFQVNMTGNGQQIYPSVASDGVGQFLVAWSGFVGGLSSFDLFAQRFSPAQTLVPPAAPYVSALSQTRLSVTWPDMAGFQVAHYEVYVDGSTSPSVVEGNLWSATGLSPGSTHSFRLAYRLADGSLSPPSPSAMGTTWGEDGNFDGLPDDWQQPFWGADSWNWPASSVDSDGDGASNLQEFLAGTDPVNAASVLKVTVTATDGGYGISWNSQPGLLYQVQTCENFGSWTNLGSPRFSHGAVDGVSVGAGGSMQLFRVIRLR